MADVDRVVRQWLETDAALGVSDVPLARPAANSAAPVPARPPVATPARGAAPAPVPTPPTARPAPIPPARPAAPATPPATLIPNLSRSVPVPARTSFALPPTPAGNVADLPSITRAQKEAAFAQLKLDIDAFASPFLSDVCTRTVFGEGDCDAALMFVGEGPGGEEDRTGRPFVGRSGQLLDKMIAAIGYQRPQVFIGNIVKLRAADWTEDGGRLQDRPPTPEEVARWIPFLHQQIEIIRPKVIVTLGAPAVKYLTGATEGVMKIRGTWLAYRGIPVMPTYHPSFVLRAYTEENRRKVWNDLKAAVQRIRGT